MGKPLRYKTAANKIHETNVEINPANSCNELLVKPPIKITHGPLNNCVINTHADKNCLNYKRKIRLTTTIMTLTRNLLVTQYHPNQEIDSYK